MRRSALNELDKASYRNRGGYWQKVVTWYKSLCFNKIGVGAVIKGSVQIILTDNAVLEMGNNCTIQDYTLIQLTKPNPHLIIGDNVVIGRDNIITAKAKMTIGNNTIIGSFVQIIDHNHSTVAGEIIRNQKAEIKEVYIGEDCWIGAGVKILCGAHVGDGCVIGANAVVIGDIPPYSIAVGVPARVVGKRE